MENMSDDQKQESFKQFDEYSQNASEADVEKIASKLDGMNRGPIAKVWGNVTKMWKLIKDPNAAWGAKAVAIGALLYLVSPIDAIPDFIPFAGLLDDVGVITAAVASLAYALSEYDDD